ncbi:thermonuclease family protein [Halobacillus salinus]|uniref:thermonuclease family protein n=1 Tax=Halobacillus salinus TaxID=192814 RepID=UPI0020CA45A6|nr:thermonuclease family protein [Halobacillus salinus]
MRRITHHLYIMMFAAIVLALAGCSVSAPADKEGEQATIAGVVDGDTVKVDYKGTEESVRLLLVDTPETKHPSLPVQPFGPEASAFAKETLTEGKEVRLEFDGPKRDKYDRLLAYLWVDGENFNRMLLEEGLARYAYIYDPPYTYQDSFEKAEAQAEEKGIGIWSIPGYVTEDGFESEAAASSSPEESSDEPDRDCSDFDRHEQAQAFFESEGGPESDPHDLDRNNDGLACESI